MTIASYKQFCPVAMAAEILCTRWTVVLLREFIAGSTRFNELRRGAPRMSPALLSQRLKDLEEAGLVRRRKAGGRGSPSSYQITARAESLRSALTALNSWGNQIAKEVGATVEPRW